MNRDQLKAHNRAAMPSLSRELAGSLGDLMREFGATLQYAQADGHEVGTEIPSQQTGIATYGAEVGKAGEARKIGPKAQPVEIADKAKAACEGANQ